MSNYKSFPEIDNVFVEHIIQIIEQEYNNEYKVFHENVIILIDSSHSVEIEKLKSISKINHFVIYRSKDLKVSKNNLLCLNENTLLVHFKERHVIKINPPKEIPDIISFGSNVSKTQNLNGYLFPNYEYVEGKIIHEEPISFFICSFDLED